MDNGGGGVFAGVKRFGIPGAKFCLGDVIQFYHREEGQEPEIYIDQISGVELTTGQQPEYMTYLYPEHPNGSSILEEDIIRVVESGQIWPPEIPKPRFAIGEKFVFNASGKGPSEDQIGTVTGYQTWIAIGKSETAYVIAEEPEMEAIQDRWIKGRVVESKGKKHVK